MELHQIDYLGQVVACAIEAGIKSGLEALPAPAKAERAERIHAATLTVVKAWRVGASQVTLENAISELAATLEAH
jgi:hypothetical protein